MEALKLSGSLSYIKILLLYFHTQLDLFLQAFSSGRPAIRYSPKGGSEVVGIWRNMTVQDLANVLKKDVGKCL